MSAPAFSSFPPSFSSFPDLEPGPSFRQSQLSKTKRSHDKDKHDVDRVGKNSSGKSREKKHKRSHRKDDAFTDDHSMNDERLKAKDDLKYTTRETSRLYYSDVKGDLYNIQYGGLHAGDVPKYHIVDRGRHVLGLSYAWTATRRSGKGVEVGPSGRRKMPSLTDSSSRALLAAPPTRRVLQSGDTYKHQEIDGYLRLPSTRRQDQNEQSYRSITASKRDADSDSESSDASDHLSEDESSADEAGAVILTSHQETLKLLELQLNEDPSSVDRWLQLLSHTLSTIPITSKNATKARSEISISILARALGAHPRNGASKLLRLRYLKAGEEVWHESKVRAEWEEALKLGGVEIWMEWLEWRTRRANAGVDGIVEDAVRVLSLLSQSEQGELAKVRVFWRVAVVLQSAGFVERATTMFQAQAELMFEVPQALYGLPHEMQLDQLEDFWESEAPRVGEDGSRGWAAWVSSGGEGQGSPPSKTEATDVAELDPYRQWATRESHIDHIQFLPSRLTDSTDDPYSTILFSDIRSLLIHLETSAAKNAFRRAWLSVIGLHIPGFSASLSSSSEINWDDRWNQGYLTRRSYLNGLFPRDAVQNRLATEAFSGVIVGREKEYASDFGPVKCWGYGVVEPLDTLWIPEKGIMKVGMWGREDVEGLNEGFVRLVFAQLRLGADDAEWDMLSLAFEAALNIKSALKHSRALLSQNESLPHWAAHAQLETMRGRLDDARKVYQTVLIASPAASTLKGTSSLWWNWAQMEWITGNSTQTLHVILHAARVEGQGGVAVLRCKRGLDDAIKDEPDWKAREGWIKLRALLELLAGADTSAALGVFDHHLFGERKKGARRESLMVACLLMLYQHGVLLKNPMPPSVLRQRVEKALDEYPSNSVILGLFLAGERGQGVWGRVRSVLGESGGKAKDVPRRVEEVWIAGWERGRWSSEIERTRSGLAGAVENERTRASHVMWRIYIEFEIRAGQLERAKKLLFRAIRECPLVKELYLLAFGPLRGVFSGSELSGIADTMAERGLRLRRGLDEGLEGWKGEMEDGSSSDSERDEIVDNARELRRLMPY